MVAVSMCLCVCVSFCHANEQINKKLFVLYNALFLHKIVVAVVVVVGTVVPTSIPVMTK